MANPLKIEKRKMAGQKESSFIKKGKRIKPYAESILLLWILVNLMVGKEPKNVTNNTSVSVLFSLYNMPPVTTLNLIKNMLRFLTGLLFD